MKCVVVSDNHTNREVFRELIDYYQEQEVEVFHCGDSEMLSTDKLWQGVHKVTGNCDYDAGFPREQLVEVNGKKILLVHGHRHLVNVTLEKLAEEAMMQGAKIAFYGHTHRLDAQVVNGVLCVNPGSISIPRGLYHDTPTYAIVDINDSVTVQYFTANHQPVEELVFEFTI